MRSMKNFYTSNITPIIDRFASAYQIWDTKAIIDTCADRSILACQQAKHAATWMGKQVIRWWRQKSLNETVQYPAYIKRNFDVPKDTSGLLQYCSNKRVRRMLVVQDGENIAITARNNFGMKVDQRLFAKAMKNRCREECFCHVFASGNTPDRVVGGPYPSPWELRFNQIEFVQKMGEWERRSNSDYLILFAVGNLINELGVDTLLLMTGDGDLASDLARFAKQISKKPISVLTLSVPSSTSARLQPQSNNLFDGNFEMGADFLVGESLSPHCNRYR